MSSPRAGISGATLMPQLMSEEWGSGSRFQAKSKQHMTNAIGLVFRNRLELRNPEPRETPPNPRTTLTRNRVLD
eukprot:4189917-Amphidinium_carterae.1